MTKKPVTRAGLKTIIVTMVLPKGVISNKINVIKIPVPNIIKSIGRKSPKINEPLLVFAGIK